MNDDKFVVSRRQRVRTENIEAGRTFGMREHDVSEHATYDEAIAARNLYESRDGGWDATGTKLTVYTMRYPSGD